MQVLAIRFAGLALLSSLLGCSAEPLDSKPETIAVAELGSEAWVFDLSPEDEAELGAAREARDRSPEDEALRAAYNRVHGRTWRALQLRGDRLVTLGQGRWTEVPTHEVELRGKEEGRLEVLWLKTGEVEFATAGLIR